MGRSLKKGPYVADQLMTKVEKMNSTREKRVIKTWSRASTCLLYTSSLPLAYKIGRLFARPIEEIFFDGEGVGSSAQPALTVPAPAS